MNNIENIKNIENEISNYNTEISNLYELISSYNKNKKKLIIDEKKKDKTIYTLYHPIYGKNMFTRGELLDNYSFFEYFLDDIIQGKKKCVNGWSATPDNIDISYKKFYFYNKKLNKSHYCTIRTLQTKYKLKDNLNFNKMMLKINNTSQGWKVDWKITEMKNAINIKRNEKKRNLIEGSGYIEMNLDDMNKKFYFYNFDYGEVYLTYDELINKYKLRRYKIYCLVSKKIDSYKGWKVDWNKTLGNNQTENINSGVV